MVLKWGIVGAGKISTQFAKALSICEDHTLIAIASQDHVRADAFAKEFNLPKAYGSYKELAEDDEVDIVYVGNLNTQHLPVSKLMLQHNKHVLCEKPLTLNEKQTTELIKIAETNNKFLMEAVWSRFFPVYDKLKELIKSDVIGEVLYVNATFGRKFDYIERIVSKELGGGTILDLGVYTLQFIQFIFGGDEPINVTSQGHLNDTGVDESATAVLTYTGCRTGVMSSSGKVELPNEAIICGTKGILRIPRFWSPTTIITATETIEYELPQTDVQFRNSYTVGLTYEIQEVGKCIESGLLESPKMTHKETIQLARLMDKVRKGAGVIFESD